MAVPMKKKKKVDTTAKLQRNLKKKKLLEKQVRRLEKFGRQLKPIDEIIGDAKVRREADIRKRESAVLTFEECEDRALLHKAWTRYCMVRHIHELEVIKKARNNQQMALDELRKESEDLYQAAIQTDESLIPLDIRGPSETPPIKDFEACDGEYIDKTRKY